MVLALVLPLFCVEHSVLCILSARDGGASLLVVSEGSPVTDNTTGQRRITSRASGKYTSFPDQFSNSLHLSPPSFRSNFVSSYLLFDLQFPKAKTN